MKWVSLFSGAIALIVLMYMQGCEGKKSESIQEKAERLAKESIIVDTHLDVPYRLWKHPADISGPTGEGHFDYPRARIGGLNAAFMAIYIPASYQESGGAKLLADSLIDLVYSFQERWPDQFQVVSSPEEIRDHFHSGKVLLPMGIENGAAIEDDLKNIEHFYNRGVRYMTLSHSKNNLICDSSYDPERRWQGLSPFGREVVKEMNRVGMMVDISHVSEAAFYQVLEISSAPVIASHSACRVFTPGFERNLSDSMIQKLAEKGGIVQINFGSFSLDSNYNSKSGKAWQHMRTYLKEHGLSYQDSAAQAYFQQYKKEQGMDPGDVAELVDHIDHVVKLVGVDFVGFGSDFDGVTDVPEGVKDVSSYPAIVEEMLRRGYLQEDIQKICGQNILRVWSAVEQAAEQK